MHWNNPSANNGNAANVVAANPLSVESDQIVVKNNVALLQRLKASHEPQSEGLHFLRLTLLTRKFVAAGEEAPPADSLEIVSFSDGKGTHHTLRLFPRLKKAEQLRQRAEAIFEQAFDGRVSEKAPQDSVQHNFLKDESAMSHSVSIGSVPNFDHLPESKRSGEREPYLKNLARLLSNDGEIQEKLVRTLNAYFASFERNSDKKKSLGVDPELHRKADDFKGLTSLLGENLNMQKTIETLDTHLASLKERAAGSDLFNVDADRQKAMLEPYLTYLDDCYQYKNCNAAYRPFFPPEVPLPRIIVRGPLTRFEERSGFVAETPAGENSKRLVSVPLQSETPAPSSARR